VVIADTSVWIPYFRNPQSAEQRVLDRLIDRDELVMVGVILMELLQGCRTKSDMDGIKDIFSAFPYLETSPAVWARAGEVSSALWRRGVTLPFTDLIIGTLAIENQCEVYSHDPHFQKIPDLRHYSPTPR
jgi:predicted nucleic acid-binding protein